MHPDAISLHPPLPTATSALHLVFPEDRLDQLGSLVELSLLVIGEGQLRKLVFDFLAGGGA